MREERFKLLFTVPHSHLEEVKAAIFAAGAGTSPDGKYTQVCFQSPGIGQFRAEPSSGAKPFVGELGVLEHVEEMKVETLCVGREVVREAVDALKR